MTFDFAPSTTAARDRARRAAIALADAAAVIDGTATIADTLHTQVREALASSDDRLAWAAGVEEIAAVSGSLAIAAMVPPAAASPAGAGMPWAGLRGVDVAAARAGLANANGELGVAAVLVGLGRGALDAALAMLREAQRDGERPEQQHWLVADAATELDAARLMLWRAATAAGPGTTTAVAMARMQARAAAASCVAAARRVFGADTSAAAASLDRIGRDVDTASLVFGGPEAEETAVAAGVLPAATTR